MNERLPGQHLILLRGVLSAAFVATIVIVALGQIGRGAHADIWDDALFFRRVAYNMLHHGFAGWNLREGPVYVATSQLYQLIAAGLLALAPRHFNLASIIWSAACVCGTFLVLRDAVRKERRSEAGMETAVLFVLLQAPPIILAITTGMDTATVFIVLALFLHSIRSERPRPVAWALANVLVYLARPDVLLLSLIVSVGVLSAPREGRARLLVTFFLVTGGLFLLLSAGLKAYYGTALPLATFLKLNPLSIYDKSYIACSLGNKGPNLILVSLLVIPIVPLIAMRLDRLNASLAIAGLAFIGFHLAATNEIMGYHVRFYAPAVLVFVFGALRGVSAADSVRRKLLIFAAASGAAALALLAYSRAWIENATHGSYLDQVALSYYLIYFLGIAACGLLLLLHVKHRTQIAASLAAILVVWMGVSRIARPFSIASDAAIYAEAAAHDSDLVGLGAIVSCFPEPVQLAHSEIGIPGVMLPESRVIDYSGLANRSVVAREFDFERLCVNDRPEFVFRPHWSHKKLNEQLSASPCLASNYVLAPQPSGCPLFVRADLAERFNACVPASPR